MFVVSHLCLLAAGLTCLNVALAALDASPPSYRGSWRAVGHAVVNNGTESFVYIYNYDFVRNRSSIITYGYKGTGPADVTRLIYDHASNQTLRIKDNTCSVTKSASVNLNIQVLRNQVDLHRIVSSANVIATGRDIERGIPVDSFEGTEGNIKFRISWTDGASPTSSGTTPYSFAFSVRPTLQPFKAENDDEEEEEEEGILGPGSTESSTNEVSVPETSTTEGEITVAEDTSSPSSTHFTRSTIRTTTASSETDDIERDIAPILRIYLLSFVYETDKDELEIPAGVYCKGYRDPLGSRPPSFSKENKTSLSFKTEIARGPGSESTQWFDGYLSWASTNLLYRLDVANGNSSAWQSIVSMGRQQMFYIMHPEQGKCEAQNRSTFDLPSMDVQMALVDPRLAMLKTKYDTVGQIATDVERYFYGKPVNEMDFKKHDSRRGIPCTVYALIREDWPYSNSEMTLWEWCLHIDQDNSTLHDYPVALEIFKGQPGSFVSFANYSFYHTEQADRFLTDLRDFDVSPCFEERDGKMLRLVFQLELGSDGADYVASPEFLFNIRDTIINSIDMPAYDAVRIQHVNTVIAAGNTAVYAEFTILEKLSRKDQGARLEDFKDQLEDAINEGLFIEFNNVPIVMGSLETREEFISRHESTSSSSEFTLLRRMVRDLGINQKHDDSGIRSQSKQVNLFVAYGFATLLFTLGFGVAMAEWYLRFRGAPQVFVRV